MESGNFQVVYAILIQFVYMINVREIISNQKKIGVLTDKMLNLNSYSMLKFGLP